MNSMEIGNFSLRILGQSETADGYVPMVHGKVYSLLLGNHSRSEYANLVVKIDGLEVGRFQLDPRQVATLERPQDARQRFTFFASHTTQATQVGESYIGRNDKGLVEVTFTPATLKPRPKHGGSPAILKGGARSMGFDFDGDDDRGMDFGDDVRSMGPDLGGSTRSKGSGFGSGVTGMTGHSDQEFGQATEVIEYPHRAVTITLRLVEAPRGPQALPGRTGNTPPPPVGSKRRR